MIEYHNVTVGIIKGDEEKNNDDRRYKSSDLSI